MGVFDRLDALPRPLQGAAGNALKDLRSIAESVQGIPELSRYLASIAADTASLNDEVRKMRAEVEEIRKEVGELNSSLTTKLDDLSGALHPLRRTLGRFGRAEKDDVPEDG